MKSAEAISLGRERRTMPRAGSATLGALVMARRSDAGYVLSRREQQLMDGLVRGLSDKELACELSLSRHTVRSYLKRLYLELGVHNRTQAVVVSLDVERRLVNVPNVSVLALPIRPR